MNYGALVEHAKALSDEFGRLLAATKQLVETAPRFSWLLADVSAARANYNSFLLTAISEEYDLPLDPTNFENLVRGYESDYVRLENMFLAAVDELSPSPGKGCGA